MTFEYGRNISGDIFTHWNDTINSEIANLVYTKNQYAFNESITDAHDYLTESVALVIASLSPLTIANEDKYPLSGLYT